MGKLWASVVAFFKSLIGASVIPPEVSAGDADIAKWFDVYRAKASWLQYEFVTADGMKRKRQRFTLNPARILASEMAGLVLSEPPEVAAGPLVDVIIKREAFWDNLRKNVEYQGALGGQAIKAYVSDGEIRVDFVRAPNFIPLSWDNSRVYEAAFLDRRAVVAKSYVRVETHRRNGAGGYSIESRAFDVETGNEVPLGSVCDDWKAIEPVATSPVAEPLFVYISNPEANNINPESPLGISMFANALDTIQALDIAFDGFKTEMLMGRQRVALPSTVMRGYTDPDTGKRKLGFDPTDEAYIRLEGDDASKFVPSDLTGELRVEAWRAAIQLNLDLLAVQTGFDAGYFAFDGTSVKTATEVISENSHTYKTMMAYRGRLETALKELFRAINALGAALSVEGAASGEPAIVFDDGVIEDRNSRAKYHMDLVNARLEDRVTAIMAIHGLDEERAAEMAERIKSDTVTVTNADLFGLNGNPGA